ncbi:MAG: YlcI/YnfO family protein, partial [Acidimicrobiales bacterium]
TDKLRLRLEAGEARISRSTLVADGGKTYVSFGVLAKREVTAFKRIGVAGHDVGITRLVTGSDGSVVENPKASEQVRKKLSRYQRRMDRQHRTGSPKCFNPDGTHISGACYWKDRSRRAQENVARLKMAHARAARIRRDAIHKASYRAATTNALNILEDLRVEQMGRRGFKVRILGGWRLLHASSFTAPSRPGREPEPAIGSVAISRYHEVMAKQTTVRLPDELADEAEAVARVRGTSVNALIVDSLSAEVARVREDKDFVTRARKLLERDKELLDRLAK